MKIRLEILRFRNEDVIAASGIGGFCQNDGRHYYIAQIVPVEGRDNMLRMTGTAYDYSPGAGLTELGALADYGDDIILPTDAYALKEQSYYYAPFGHTGYLILCELQNHGH